MQKHKPSKIKEVIAISIWAATLILSIVFLGYAYSMEAFPGEILMTTDYSFMAFIALVIMSIDLVLLFKVWYNKRRSRK